jgi:hypothetical protein
MWCVMCDVWYYSGYLSIYTIALVERSVYMIPSGLECKCGGSFPTFPSNVSDEDWIEAFIERCQEDNGEALQNEIQEQEDLEIISFLQKCEDLMFEERKRA